MNTRSALLTLPLGILVLLAGSLPAQNRPSTTQPAPTPSYRERYSVLYERNIFLKERGRSYRPPYSGPPVSREVTAPRPVEASYLLTGIVLEDGQMRAYFEDTANSRILRLNPGDAVARGHVTEIAINGVIYEFDGRQSWIDIGKTLTGQSFAPPAFAVSGSATAPSTQPGTTGVATSTSPGPLPDPNNPNLTLEERMKLRRAQELNRK